MFNVYYMLVSKCENIILLPILLLIIWLNVL